MEGVGRLQPEVEVIGPRKRRRWSRKTLGAISWSVVMWAVVAAVLAPLVWAVLSSFKPDTETMGFPPTIWPKHWTVSNYIGLFKVLPFSTFFLNSLWVSIATTVATLTLSVSAAYATARFRARAAEATSFIGLAAYMVPTVLVVVPIFTIAYALHALNNLAALVVLYTAFFTPFALWQLRSYFAGLPIELEEAAMVDGATRLEAFYMIAVPQALPGIIATCIWTFGISWNEYLFASLLLYSPQRQTLNAGLANALIGEYNLYSWGILMSGATLMTVPVLIGFMLVQRNLVAGLGGGAIKG